MTVAPERPTVVRVESNIPDATGLIIDHTGHEGSCIYQGLWTCHTTGGIFFCTVEPRTPETFPQPDPKKDRRAIKFVSLSQDSPSLKQFHFSCTEPRRLPTVSREEPLSRNHPMVRLDFYRGLDGKLHRVD
jgi:hypothetical protein